MKNKAVHAVLHDVPINETPAINCAQLIHINGCGALTTQAYSVADSYYGNRFLSQIRLHGTPLVQINSPGCPTCCSLLATGYGIGNAHCQELNEIQDRINAPFVSLDTSIAALEPLLSLMESGLYLIADAECCPTDGNGNFFWNAPNEPTENPATAGVLLNDADYAYVSGHPIYLFPTQDTDCCDETRVDYYVECFKKSAQAPRAVLYNFSAFLSFVLDGHHKACAAALMKKPLRSIIIIPCSGYRYHQADKKMIPSALCFASIEIPAKDIPSQYLPPMPKWTNSPPNFRVSAGTITHRDWAKEYLDSAAAFPSVTDYATMIAAEIPCSEPVSEDLIRQCLSDLTEENQQRLKAILLILKKQHDARIKQVALSCAKQLPFCTLKEQACRVLVKMKNDQDIEQFFIDYLVDHTDQHDPILEIANSYWD